MGLASRPAVLTRTMERPAVLPCSGPAILVPSLSPLVYGGCVVTAQRLILGLMGGSVGTGWSVAVSVVLTAQGGLWTTGWHAVHWLARSVTFPGPPRAFLHSRAGKLQAWFPAHGVRLRLSTHRSPEAP